MVDTLNWIFVIVVLLVVAYLMVHPPKHLTTSVPELACIDGIQYERVTVPNSMGPAWMPVEDDEGEEVTCVQ